MRIAFCTSAMNRIRELEQTLARNLEAVRHTPHFVALCDLKSGDGTEEYVRTELLSHLSAGKLVYFRATEASDFHAAMAKNASHRLGLRHGATVLFNADPEQFVTEITIRRLVETFSRAQVVVHECTPEDYETCAGRIAAAAEDWELLGGYDEALEPMTLDSYDFLHRCRAIGRTYVRHGSDLPRPVQVDRFAVLSTTKFKHLDREGLGRVASRLSADNLSIMLRRPVQLSLRNQRRFAGIVNFREAIVL